jgi:hypothetical protein
MRAVRALFRAANERANEDDLERLSYFLDKETKRRRGSFARRSYALTQTFAQKPITDRIPPARECWLDAISDIKLLAKAFFPDAAIKIALVDSKIMTNWKNWFLGIIEVLDETRVDITSWKSCPAIRARKDSNADHNSLDIGRNQLLTILRRYQASQNIGKSNRLRPRGPRPGSVKKNNEIRNQLTQLFSQSDRTLSGTEAAKILGVSRQRISVLRKELKV